MKPKAPLAFCRIAGLLVGLSAALVAAPIEDRNNTKPRPVMTGNIAQSISSEIGALSVERWQPGDTVSVKWGSNVGKVKSYEVLRSDKASSTPGKVITKLRGSESLFVDKNLPIDTQFFFYWLRITKADGSVEILGPARTQPFTPVNTNNSTAGASASGK